MQKFAILKQVIHIATTVLYRTKDTYPNASTVDGGHPHAHILVLLKESSNIF
jgi:hypothetical protein